MVGGLTNARFEASGGDSGGGGGTSGSQSDAADANTGLVDDDEADVIDEAPTASQPVETTPDVERTGGLPRSTDDTNVKDRGNDTTDEAADADPGQDEALALGPSSGGIQGQTGGTDARGQTVDNDGEEGGEVTNVTTDDEPTPQEEFVQNQTADQQREQATSENSTADGGVIDASDRTENAQESNESTDDQEASGDDSGPTDPFDELPFTRRQAAIGAVGLVALGGVLR